MDLTAAQGRFGVDYLQLLCSQAGLPCTEPRAGEDVRALDATIGFNYGDAHVQVKCTTKIFTPKTQRITIPIEDGWLQKWQRLHVLAPLYLVVVQVQKQKDWISHPVEHTHVAARAYWCRIDPPQVGRSLFVRPTDRLTVDTLRAWSEEREQAMNAKAGDQ